MTISGTRLVRLLTALAITVPGVAVGQDVLTVGSQTFSTGDPIVVPIYLRDVSGTVLGGDAAVGRRIQDLSLTIEASPGAAVQAMTFARAGVTAALTPVFEQEVSSGNRHTWVVTFDETGFPVPLNLDATAPGDQVAELTVQPSPSAAVVQLAWIATTTALGNQSGGLAETTDNGHLAIRNGSLIKTDIFADGFESGNAGAWSFVLP